VSDLASARRALSVAVRTLGCKVNRVESDSIAAELLGHGVRLVPEADAEVIIVNTCTVTGEADAKARKAVRQALRAAREPVVVVTGCLAAVDPGALRALGERVVVEPDKGLITARVTRLLELDAVPEDAPHAPVVRTGEGFRTRALLKIEDGCDNFCTYCIVPAARGVPRGVPLASAVSDADALVRAGVSEIVLTGINIGRYRDPETGAGLADLIAAVAATGVRRLRLSSIEPPDLTDDLIGTLARTRAVCEHLHVPLQSGSDSVLSAMGRKYTSEQYAEKIAAARAAIDGLAVTTDVIAGFPGETEEQHAETLRFVGRMGFSKLHVFRYSARAGTPAAALPQVEPVVRAARAAELRALGDILCEQALVERTPRLTEVLFERVDGGFATGTTRDYLHVRMQENGVAPGEVRDVLLTAGDVTRG
jgi:threonylcarbamoyladenosine tRNA methylthiotransferase MtaB